MLAKTFFQAQGPCPGAQIKIWCQGPNVTGAKSYLLGISMEEIDWIFTGFSISHFFRNDFLCSGGKKTYCRIRIGGMKLPGTASLKVADSRVLKWLPHVSTVERSVTFASLILLKTDLLIDYIFRLKKPSDTFRKTVDGEAQSTSPEKGGWSTTGAT